MRKRRAASAATTRSMRSKGRRASVDQFWLEFVGGLGGISAEEMSEDCLNLNVWTPLQKDGNMLVLFLGFVSLSVSLSCSLARRSWVKGQVFLKVMHKKSWKKREMILEKYEVDCGATLSKNHPFGIQSS